MVLKVMTVIGTRPEVIDAGAAKLIGTDLDRIYLETMNLIEDSKSYYHMSNASNPYGDGRAGERIVHFMLGHPTGKIKAVLGNPDHQLAKNYSGNLICQFVFLCQTVLVSVQFIAQKKFRSNYDINCPTVKKLNSG